MIYNYLCSKSQKNKQSKQRNGYDQKNDSFYASSCNSNGKHFF